MTSGIYVIENMINNKKYIGQSVNVEKRLNNHKRMLVNNTHFNQHLQSSFNHYGLSDFNFRIIKECSEKDLDNWERWYIRVFNTQNRECGYNILDGGAGGGCYTDEMKQKFSKMQIGEKNHMYGVTGKKHPRYGKTHTNEVKQKLKELGQKRVGENNPFFGKKHSEETKQKISQANKGRNLWSDEDKQKMRKERLKGYARIIKKGRCPYSHKQRYGLINDNGNIIKISLFKECLELLMLAYNMKYTK